MIELINKHRPWGHPWHGLCRNGVITTADGVNAGTHGAQPPGGDTFVFRIPGAPGHGLTPEAEAAEKAAGREWLDYVVIAGNDHRVYGHPMNTHFNGQCWLYVDDDGDRWICALKKNGSALVIEFYRTGNLIDPAAGTQPVQVLPLDTSGASGALLQEKRVIPRAADRNDEGLFIDAITPMGDKIALVLRSTDVLYQLNGTTSPAAMPNFPVTPWHNPKKFGGVWEIALIGKPGDGITAQISTPIRPIQKGTISTSYSVEFLCWIAHRDANDAGGLVELLGPIQVNWDSAADWPFNLNQFCPMGRVAVSALTCDTSPRTRTEEHKELLGAEFDEHGNLRLHELTVSQTTVTTTTPGSVTLEGGVIVGNVTVEQQTTGSITTNLGPGSIAFEASHTAAHLYTNTAGVGIGEQVTTTIRERVGTREINHSSTQNVAASAWRFSGSHLALTSNPSSGPIYVTPDIYPDPYYDLSFYHDLGYLLAVPVRFANGVYGLISLVWDNANQLPGSPELYLGHHGIFTAAGLLPTETLRPITEGIGYATSHPVTRALEYDLNTPVCFV